MGPLRAFWRKDPGLFVSSSVHVMALVLLLANFAFPPKFEEAVESVPVEMVTASDLNEIMNGEKTAKQMDKSQRVVDKVADVKDNKPAPPVPVDKKDTPPPPSPEKANADPGEDDKPTKMAALPPPPPVAPPPPIAPPPPVPTPPEKPVDKVEAPTPPPKPEEMKPQPEEAEAVEPPKPKVEPKKEPKKEPPKKVAKPEPKKPQPKKPVPRPVEVKEAKVVPDPPKRPEPPQPEKPDLKKRTLDQVAKLLDNLKPDPPKPEPPVKQRSGNEVKDAKPSNFSFDKITAFLDHDKPQRTASSGQQLTKLASLGSPTAHAEKMSPSMMARIDGWLIDHYRGCWSYFGLGATQDYVPKVHVRMAPDGSLIGRPALLNPPSDPNLKSLAESAVRAVNKCDPLPVPDWFKAHYESWRDRTVRFDPKEMS